MDVISSARSRSSWRSSASALPPQELVSFYRRIFNGVFNAPGARKAMQPARLRSASRSSMPARPRVRGAGSVPRRSGRPLPDAQVAAARITAERANRLTGGMRGSSEDSDQIGGPFLFTLNVLFDHSAFEIHKRAQILSAQKAAGSFAVEVGKQIEEIGWVLDEGGNSRFVSVIPTLWVFGESVPRPARWRRGQAAVGSNPLPWMVQEESYLNPILLAASLPFGLYPDRRTVRMLQRDFRMPAKAAVLMSPIQTDFRGGGRPALLYTGRKGQLVTLDLFDPRINNYNFVVSAESGAGKSFLLNNLCQQYFAQARSSASSISAAATASSARCARAATSIIGEEHLVLNPSIWASQWTAMTGIRDLDGGRDRRRNGQCGDAQTRHHLEWNLLKSAVQWAIDSGRAEAGIDAVREWLGAYPANTASDLDRVDHLVPTARELAFNLRDFGSDGAYGHYFNGPRPSTYRATNSSCSNSSA
jgi:conjugal transfer ATP-binding protein TraC